MMILALLGAVISGAVAFFIAQMFLARALRYLKSEGLQSVSELLQCPYC